MNAVKSFLFADVPVSVVHFILFVIARSQRWNFVDVLGQPGFWLADVLGADGGGILWWVVMVFNSLIWGGVVATVFAIIHGSTKK
jgi:hypothetical protein